MNDGDVWQLAEVVRNLAVRRDRKHLSPSEKTLYAHARNLLRHGARFIGACIVDDQDFVGKP